MTKFSVGSEDPCSLTRAMIAAAILERELGVQWAFANEEQRDWAIQKALNVQQMLEAETKLPDPE